MCGCGRHGTVTDTHLSEAVSQYVQVSVKCLNLSNLGVCRTVSGGAWQIDPTNTDQCAEKRDRNYTVHECNCYMAPNDDRFVRMKYANECHSLRVPTNTEQLHGTVEKGSGWQVQPPSRATKGNHVVHMPTLAARLQAPKVARAPSMESAACALIG